MTFWQTQNNMTGVRRGGGGITSQVGEHAAGQGSGGTAWHTPPAGRGWHHTQWPADWSLSGPPTSICEAGSGCLANFKCDNAYVFLHSRLTAQNFRRLGVHEHRKNETVNPALLKQSLLPPSPHLS